MKFVASSVVKILCCKRSWLREKHSGMRFVSLMVPPLPLPLLLMKFLAVGMLLMSFPQSILNTHFPSPHISLQSSMQSSMSGSDLLDVEFSVDDVLDF